MSIEKIVDMLATCKVNENTFNQYTYEHDLGRVTRNNLSVYLNHMKIEKCKAVLIGEAAGYKGCRLSGVPFTSEYILINGVYNPMFGSNKGFIVFNPKKLN